MELGEEWVKQEVERGDEQCPVLFLNIGPVVSWARIWTGFSICFMFGFGFSNNKSPFGFVVFYEPKDQTCPFLKLED